MGIEMGILESMNLQHFCTNTRYQIRCMKNWLSVNISSCTAMSTNLKTLYLDAIWLKYQGP